MQRFLLQENIARYERFLKMETVERSRQSLWRMLQEARRDLALLEAATFGVQAGFLPFGTAPHNMPQAPAMQGAFRDEFEASSQLQLLIDPRAGLRIIDANEAYRAATLTGTEICGNPMFEVFPDNPDDPTADGVSNLFSSLRNTALLGQPQTMRIQRYDVRNAEGVFVERYWRPVNTPIFDAGRLIYLLHSVQDVTEEVLAARVPAPRRLELSGG